MGFENQITIPSQQFVSIAAQKVTINAQAGLNPIKINGATPLQKVVLPGLLTNGTSPVPKSQPTRIQIQSFRPATVIVSPGPKEIPQGSAHASNFQINGHVGGQGQVRAEINQQLAENQSQQLSFVQVQNGNGQQINKPQSSTIVINNSITTEFSQNAAKRPFQVAFTDANETPPAMTFQAAQEPPSTTVSVPTKAQEDVGRSSKITLNFGRLNKNQADEREREPSDSYSDDSGQERDSDDDMSLDSSPAGLVEGEVAADANQAESSSSGELILVEQNTPNSDQDDSSVNSNSDQEDLESDKQVQQNVQQNSHLHLQSGTKITIGNNSFHAANELDHDLTPSETPNADVTPEFISDPNALKRQKISENSDSVKDISSEEDNQSEQLRLQMIREELEAPMQPAANVNCKESMTEHVLQKAMMTAFQFNAGMRKDRKMYKRMFKTSTKMSAQDRKQLSAHQSNFLHCNYSGGHSFFETMNNLKLTQVRPTGPGSNQMAGRGMGAGRTSRHFYNQQSQGQDRNDALGKQDEDSFQRRPGNAEYNRQQSGRRGNRQPPSQDKTSEQTMSQKAFHHFSSALMMPKAALKSQATPPDEVQRQSMRTEVYGLNIKPGFSQGSFADRNAFQSSSLNDGAAFSKQNQSAYQMNEHSLGDLNGWRCRTCKRGHPLTKKYAKGQCQTCYKKNKKIQKEEEYMQSNPTYHSGIPMGYAQSMMQSQFGGTSIGGRPQQMNQSYEPMQRPPYMSHGHPHMLMQQSYGGTRSVMPSGQSQLYGSRGEQNQSSSQRDPSHQYKPANGHYQGHPFQQPDHRDTSTQGSAARPIDGHSSHLQSSRRSAQPEFNGN